MDNGRVYEFGAASAGGSFWFSWKKSRGSASKKQKITQANLYKDKLKKKDYDYVISLNQVQRTPRRETGTIVQINLKTV